MEIHMDNFQISQYSLKSDSTQKIGKQNPLKFFASTKIKEETKVSRTAAIPVGGDP